MPAFGLGAYSSAPVSAKPYDGLDGRWPQEQKRLKYRWQMSQDRTLAARVKGFGGLHYALGFPPGVPQRLTARPQRMLRSN